MTVETTSTTEAVLQHHLQAIFARDLDAIVSDFADDAVFFTPFGSSKGPDQIRAAFAAIMNLVTPEVMAEMKLGQQHIDGEFAYILWSAGAHITTASDTFCVRNGKIVLQTFVGAGPLLTS